MKLFRALLVVATLIVAATLIMKPATAVLGAAAGFVALTLLATPRARLCATLTGTEILIDVMDAFKQALPRPLLFATDFRATPLIKDKVYTAHIASLPSVTTPNDANGYANGVQEAQSLLTDVPVTVSNIKAAPLRWKHLSLITEQKKEYSEIIGGAGYALAKAMVDDLLAGVTAANFSQSTTFATADSDYDMIGDATTKLNNRGAMTTGRFGIVNSAVAEVLDRDSRIASKDFSGQQAGGFGYRRFLNVGGFSEIVEYPGLPANGENLTGFFGDRRSFAILAGPPETQADLAQQLGITQIMSWESVTDPDSGITMAAVKWQQPGTGDLYFAPVLLWGYKAGRQGSGNPAGTAADYAGLRLKTA